MRFLGFLPEETLAVIYRLAGVFVFPSLYEGFGLPPLEAMASGTPVVTSNVSSLPEVAGDAAVLVDPYDPRAIADGIYRVLTDERCGASCAHKGLARARQFSWEQSVRRVREIYGEVRAGVTRSGRGEPVKLALVHDWLTGMRGGEKALEVLCERFPRRRAVHAGPRARIGVAGDRTRCRSHTSFVQRLPLVSRLYRQYLPLFPTAIEQFAFDRFDLVVSMSHCCAKSVVAPGARQASLLLPDADALRVGPVRRLLRPDADRPTRQRGDAAGDGRGWPAGTATPQAA